MEKTNEELDRHAQVKDLVILYKKVFGNEDGKKILEDLENAAGYHRSNFNTDPHEMAFREGGRAFVVRIKQLIETDLDRFEKGLQRQSEGDE